MLTSADFKSYRGRHTLLFGDSYFTSIIGPNGSGKSNSMDAISFVLGVKSSQLRSDKLKDMIYRGRIIREARINADGTATEAGADENGDTNGDANGDTQENGESQTSTQRNDPQNAWVKAVFEDDAEQTHEWQRTITSSGASEYRINNRQVTQKQYNDALEEHSILVKARNFLVFQGDVEKIATMAPDKLTEQVERISGSLEHKADYDRLKTESEAATEDNAKHLQS
jgi:structural maintenance of chromosome 1